MKSRSVALMVVMILLLVQNLHQASVGETSESKTDAPSIFISCFMITFAYGLILHVGVWSCQ